MNKLKLLITIFDLTFLGVMVFLLLNMHLLDSDIYASSQNKTKMLKIADELRQSSDDLTHFARTYVITNNKLYYEQYIHTLDIRNGEIPRPLNYDGIYWDLEKSIREKLHPETKKISFKEMLSELPFSKKEISKLRSSEQNSNDLVNLELMAFEAMNENPPNQQYAIELLHSKAYYEAKHKIMYPIYEFTHMLNKRLDENLNKIKEKIQNNFKLFLVILFIFIVGNIIFYRLMQKSLLKIIELEVEQNLKKDRQMIAQSRQAQMGRMISMIAHQWRQPLSIISMESSKVLLDIELETINEENLKKTANNILDTTIRLSKTIDDFRNFYKPNKESVTLKLEEVVEKSLNIIKTSLKNNNIEIIEEYNSNEEIELYDNEVMHVILNILQNALDIFKDKEIKNAKIIIKTKNKIISISDNAGGIPEDIIEKIFDPYFSTKDTKNGTGLGLHMSKEIIEQHHNGKLSVENKDDGACFNIEFGVITKK